MAPIFSSWFISALVRSSKPVAVVKVPIDVSMEPVNTPPVMLATPSVKISDVSVPAVSVEILVTAPSPTSVKSIVNLGVPVGSTISNFASEMVMLFPSNKISPPDSILISDIPVLFIVKSCAVLFDACDIDTGTFATNVSPVSDPTLVTFGCDDVVNVPLMPMVAVIVDAVSSEMLVIVPLPASVRSIVNLGSPVGSTISYFASEMVMLFPFSKISPPDSILISDTPVLLIVKSCAVLFDACDIDTGTLATKVRPVSGPRLVTFGCDAVASVPFIFVVAVSVPAVSVEILVTAPSPASVRSIVILGVPVESSISNPASESEILFPLNKIAPPDSIMISDKPVLLTVKSCAVLFDACDIDTGTLAAKVSPVSDPRLVIFGCDAVLNVPLMLTVAVIVPADTELNVVSALLVTFWSK